MWLVVAAPGNHRARADREAVPAERAPVASPDVVGKGRLRAWVLRLVAAGGNRAVAGGSRRVLVVAAASPRAFQDEAAAAATDRACLTQADSRSSTSALWMRARIGGKRSLVRVGCTRLLSSTM